MYEILILLTVLGMGTIFGIALTATVVVHPLLLQVKSTTAIEVFKPFFDRTHKSVLVLSIVVSLTALGASLLSGEWSWFIISLIMHLNGPYTIFAMMPLNHRLMADEVDPNSEETLSDLHRWGKLHAVRTVLNGIVFILFLLNIIYR
ncbi:MAG: DUF1772 domain-containing protein [Campylobacterota bacterium]|nr:DUF1772 domain-containing protein [Campylobacterota bacterium]